jgi:hypothetical protein
MDARKKIKQRWEASRILAETMQRASRILSAIQRNITVVEEMSQENKVFQIDMWDQLRALREHSQLWLERMAEEWEP